MSIGIYKITNLINQKSYIGQSVDIERRWIHHRNYQDNMKDYPLYRAFQKYGIENFDFSILITCSPEELNQKELEFIAIYNTYSNGYNQTLGGAGSSGFIVKLSEKDILDIYEKLKSSDLTQHQIALLYNVGDDTISEINQGKTRQLPDTIYPIRNNKRDIQYCECGAPLSKGAILCKECAPKNRRVVERPNREILKNLIYTTPFTTIANSYNVSDNSIRKWCMSFGLPTRKSEIKSYSKEEWSKI